MPDGLRIAIDVGPLHGNRTGVGVAVAHLVDHLRARDDVALTGYLVSARARTAAGERRLPLPAAAAMRAWAVADRPRVDRWLGPVDVVHGTNYTAPPSRRPTVTSVYDCWSLAHPDQAAPAVRRAGQVLRRAVRRGAHLHVSSAATAAVAAELLDTDRITVVHLGPPARPGTGSGPRADPATPDPRHADASRADPTGGRPYLVAVGTTERRKDVPALVAAFDRLIASGAGDRAGRGDLHLVVAGATGDDHDRVEDAIRHLPLAARDRVHLLGTVDAATRDRLVVGARALVYPSLDEGFGFPVLEAQQLGTPVVARAVGSVPEVGGGGVELTDDLSVEALAAAIARVIDDDGRRAELVAAGERNLTRFSWERTADELVRLYRRIVHEEPAT